MKLAVMQPYFFPYVGYFQLIAAADQFIVYDNIKYTKKGWINRNRILQNGKDTILTLQLKSASDSLDVRDRELAKDFSAKKMLAQIEAAYDRAPYFGEVVPLITRILFFDEANLFKFLHHSIKEICQYLKIETKIRISSDIVIDHGLKGEQKVLALCAAAGASRYLNAIGGIELYSREVFKTAGVDLKFIKSLPFDYKQFGDVFVPSLSIIDVLMFNSFEQVRSCITSNYELI